MAQSPALVRHEPNFVLAAHGALTICIVDGVTPLAQVTDLATQLRSNVELNPEGTAFLFIIRATAQLPAPAVRQCVDDALWENRNNLKLMATVVEGTGFVAASKRGVIANQSTPVLGHIHVKVFPDVPNACRWLTTEGATRGLAVPAMKELVSFVGSLPPTRPTDDHA